MDPLARRALLIVGSAFLGVFLLIFVISLLFRTPTIATSAPFLGNDLGDYSRINNNALRFFNGRNFVEYNLSNGQTSTLLEDILFPRIQIIDWSHDSSKVLVYAPFYLSGDVFSGFRNQRDPANLWVIDFANKKFTQLPAGFASGTFSADGQNIFMTAETDLPGFIHGEFHELAAFSLQSEKIVSVAQIPFFVDAVVTIGNQEYVIVTDASALERKVYKLGSNGIDPDAPVIRDIDLVKISAAGAIVLREEEVPDGREKEVPTVSSAEIYDANLNSVKKLNKIGDDVVLGSSDTTVFIHFIEQDESKMIRHDFSAQKTETFVVSTISDTESVVINDFVAGDNITLVDTNRGLRILGDNEPVKPIDLESLVGLDAVLKEPGQGKYVPSQDEDALWLSVYQPYKGLLPEIYGQINAEGVDPNIVDMVIVEEF